MRTPARRAAAAAAAGPPPSPSATDAVASNTRGSRARRASPVAVDPPAGAAPPRPRRAAARIQSNPKNDASGADVTHTNKDDSEHFKTRFSTKRICELIPLLEEHQKDWIGDSCFRALLSVQQVSVPVKLVKWVMQHTNPLLSEFRYKNRVIVFTRDLVCKILGLETGIEPVRLTGDHDDVKDFRDVYKEGARAKINKCIEVLKETTDRDLFMRAFTLLAMGCVYCPGTGNYIDMSYLHSLVDMSQVGNYDWATHIIGVLMDEVRKYQSFTPERLKSDHQMGSCLIILAIAYMDHLDLPPDRGPHQLNYNLPRICSVSNADFEYVMAADRNRFRSFSSTPYAAIPDVHAPIPPVAEEAMPPAGHEEEVDVVSSLDQWLQQQGSSSDQLQQIPVEYQRVAAHFSKLFKEDVIGYASVISSTIVEHINGLWMNRHAQMLSKMAELAATSRTDGSGASTSGGGGADGLSGNDGLAGSFTSGGAADGPPPNSGAGVPGPSTRPGTPIDLPSSIAVPPEASTSPTAGSGSAVAPPIGAATSTSEGKEGKVSANSSYCDDIPSFDLFKPGELEGEDHAANVDEPLNAPTSIISTPPAAATNPDTTIIDVPDAARSGSSTHDKKNRKKRAAKNLKIKVQEKRPSKRMRLDTDAKEAYKKYVNTRLLRKPIPDADGKVPEHTGFYVSYEDFYQSFKPRGEIINHVMTLFTYQFNLDESDACASGNTIIKKYAFSAVLTDKLKIGPAKFIKDSCSRELKRLNKTWKFSKLDLLFFPIVDGEHWVLVCVNLFLNKIVWFNPIKGGTDNFCVQKAKDLITNFSKAAVCAKVLKDISEFEWIYPTDYPYQNTIFNCGLYIMLYMESCNGKMMDVKPFEPDIDGHLSTALRKK
ncbi:unnamed protein product [Urochloa decumbens]|uniref:Ubiquitin-like protease family profile domain-containing protein n=1 Tax=Urochloa decumbens TaxID=240449 RepID=A0ABC8X014_9POAL